MRDLPKEVKAKIWKCLSQLCGDQHPPGLNVEPLHGPAKGLYSARVDDAHRLIFFRSSDDEVCLLYVGREQDAYRYAERSHVALLRDVRGATKPVPSEGPAVVVDLLETRMSKYLPLAEFLTAC